MKSHRWILLAFLMLSGCATSYGPNGWKGGYYDYPAGGANRYIVGFVGNGYTHSSTVREYTHRRAGELCQLNGFSGYKILDNNQEDSYYSTPVQTNCQGRSSGNTFSGSCDTSGGTLIKKSNAELIVECEGGRAPASVGNSTKLNDDSTIYDHWFYVEPSNKNKKGYDTRAKELVVRTGEDFGVEVRFNSKKPNVKMQLKLTVPSSPENFPCSTCKPGELTFLSDGHTVVLNRELSSTKGWGGFHWGIDANDPRGSYGLELSLDGVQIEAYNFEVK